jgi:hypothetical protein
VSASSCAQERTHNDRRGERDEMPAHEAAPLLAKVRTVRQRIDLPFDPDRLGLSLPAIIAQDPYPRQQPIKFGDGHPLDGVIVHPVSDVLARVRSLNREDLRDTESLLQLCADHHLVLSSYRTRPSGGPGGDASRAGTSDGGGEVSERACGQRERRRLAGPPGVTPHRPGALPSEARSQYGSIVATKSRMLPRSPSAGASPYCAAVRLSPCWLARSGLTASARNRPACEFSAQTTA